MVGNDKRLTDAEYRILSSLDDAALLPELLNAIYWMERRPSRLWRRWEEREIRPELTVEQVSAALPALVGAGLVEVRAVLRGEANDDMEKVPVQLPDGRTLMAEPHPFWRGRALTSDEVLAVVDDPTSWKFPAETDAECDYWADITEAGLEAYRRSRDERESGS